MAGASGRSGRRPKPTALKLLAGNPSKRALNKNEPAFSPLKSVAVPEWFIENDLQLAAVMWEMTTKELTGQGLCTFKDISTQEGESRTFMLFNPNGGL